MRDAMVDLPWQSVHAANHQRQYLALLSYLPLKGYRKMWMFSRHVRAIRRQLAGTPGLIGDRKSTRLNSSHGYISYAVFCLKKKKKKKNIQTIINTERNNMT